MKRPISRRGFLTRSAAIVGGLTAVGLFEARPALAEELPVFGLDPEWGAGNPDCTQDEPSKPSGCHACRACHNHGANKLFPSADAASANRAHLHCKCNVVSWGTLPATTWVALFGPPDNPVYSAVDKRDARVQEILSTGRRVYLPLVQR